MQRLLLLEKPVKRFILAMMMFVLVVLGIISFLEITNNNMIESMSHYFTGDTESEIVLEESISYTKQEIKDANLNAGVTEVRQKGAEGKKKLIFRVTKDSDGKEINRTMIGEEIVAEPVDEIVAVGTKVSVQLTPTPSNSSSTNNRGNQSGQSTSGSSNVGGGGSNQNNQGNNTITYFYCARNPQHVEIGFEVTDEATGSGHRITEWQVYYIKMTRPCTGKLEVEVPSSDFYALTDIKKTNGMYPEYIEVRIRHCGSDPYNVEPSCKLGWVYN